jgi:hypothetical protein
MRGDPYIWSGGDDLYIWTDRVEKTGYGISEMGILLSKENFKKLTIAHFVHLVDEVKLNPNSRRAFDKIVEQVRRSRCIDA